MAGCVHTYIAVSLCSTAGGLVVAHRSLSWPSVTDRCLVSTPAKPFLHTPTAALAAPILGTNLRFELKHNWESWIINSFFFFHGQHRRCPVNLMHCLPCIFIKGPLRCWTGPVMYIWLRQSGWAWTLLAMSYLMVIHMPRGNSYLDTALWSTAWLSELI